MWGEEGDIRAESILQGGTYVRVNAYPKVSRIGPPGSETDMEWKGIHV